jgi:diacylglycerol kinase
MKTEWLRLRSSFRYAATGIAHLFRHERNARIHLALAVLAVLLALLLGFSRLEWAVLAMTIGFVFVAEALNTAIEAVIDLVSPDFHLQARVAKDVSAGAVAMAAIVAVVIALFLFLPKLLALFG